jgi:hypothetical protein
MKLETFLLERWMTRHELHVDYDICESGIYPMTVDELLGLAGEGERERLLQRLLDTRLGYSEAPGSLALRSMLAAMYDDTSPDEILVATGAIEANFLAFNTSSRSTRPTSNCTVSREQSAAMSRSGHCDRKTASATTSTSLKRSSGPRRG